MEELTVRITVIGIPKVSKHSMKFLWMAFNRCLVCSESAQYHRSALFNSSDYYGRVGTEKEGLCAKYIYLKDWKITFEEKLSSFHDTCCVFIFREILSCSAKSELKFSGGKNSYHFPVDVAFLYSKLLWQLSRSLTYLPILQNGRCSTSLNFERCVCIILN